MPRGSREGPKPAAVLKAQRGAKKGTQKGRARHFTSPEELAADAARMEDERQGRKQRNEESGSDEEEGEEKKKSGSETSSDDEEDKKPLSVDNLIEIENPNRVAAKTKKLSDLTLESTSSAPQLSRREKEEIERERQKKLQEQLRMEGKTDQARADLARLALIRQEREQAAKRREAETKVKEAARTAKVENTPGMKKDDPANVVPTPHSGDAANSMKDKAPVTKK